jgi:hypothetical protein
MRQRALAAVAAVTMGVLVAQQPAPKPETVVITFHAKPGAEAELAGVIEKHWTVAREMKLVQDSPHLTLRRIEEGNKVSFTDIFTWRDAAIPDHAPPAIQTIWAQMNQLVESRGGEPGLAIASVAIVSR